MLIPARSISLRAASGPTTRGWWPCAGQFRARLRPGHRRRARWSPWSGQGFGKGPLNVELAQGPGVSLPAGTRFTVTGESDVVRSEPVNVDPISPATGSQTQTRAPHPGIEVLAGRVVGGKQPAEVSILGNYLTISSIVIELSPAELWDPLPDLATAAGAPAADRGRGGSDRRDLGRGRLDVGPLRIARG